MAVYGDFNTLVISAQSSLNGGTEGSGSLYKAIDLSTGDFAANALGAAGRALGILYSLNDSGSPVTVGYEGHMKYVAAAAINAFAPLTVTTSGYFTTAASGDYVVGKNGRVAATSGSVYDGWFENLIRPVLFDASSGDRSLYPDVTSYAAASIGIAGMAVILSTGEVAATTRSFTSGITMGVSALSGTGYLKSHGIALVRAGGGTVAANAVLTQTVSGYAIAAASGDYAWGRTLFAIASGALGKALVDFAGARSIAASWELN